MAVALDLSLPNKSTQAENEPQEAKESAAAAADEERRASQTDPVLG